MQPNTKTTYPGYKLELFDRTNIKINENKSHCVLDKVSNIYCG